MQTPDPAFRRRLLIEALTMVAASAPAQAAWLERYGVLADEIALDFDHGFRMAEGLVDDGLLRPDALPDLRAIDSIFVEMTRNGSPSQWTPAALKADVGWFEARALAQRVLALEGWDASELPEIRVVR